MTTGAGDESIAVEAMKLGASDYVVKEGLSAIRIRHVIKSALERSVLHQELAKKEALLRESHNEQRAALEELTKEQALREKFIATLSHDIRTPMTSASMVLQLLARNPESIEQKTQQIQRAIASLARVDRMVQDLLDASRLKAGESLPIYPTKQGDFIEIVRQATLELLQIHSERFVFLNASETGTLPGLWGINDILRIIENLAGNAIKYGDPTQPVTIAVGRDPSENASVVVSVHNFGNPLSMVDKNRIFAPFSRTLSAESSGKQGWGLGLSVTRGIVEAYGGKIEVESSLEKGTTFRVTLPQSSDTAAQAA